MKKLLYTDKPEVRSGYDQDASKSNSICASVYGSVFSLDRPAGRVRWNWRLTCGK